MKTIHTHDGQAHLDDFLTCAFLIAHFSNQLEECLIVRSSKIPDPKESVFIVDIGREFCPSKQIFDHHHFEEDKKNPQCSLSLVLKHFNLYEKACEAYDWIPFLEYMDCFGKMAAFNKHVSSKKAKIRIMESFVENVILDEFSKETIMDSSDLIYKVMLSIGTNFIDGIKLYEKEMNEIKDFIKVIPHVYGDILLFYKNFNPDNSNKFIEKHYPNTIMMMFPDTRTVGNFVAYRRHDNEHVDFRLVQDKSKFDFIHNNGFCASAKDWKSLLDGVSSPKHEIKQCCKCKRDFECKSGNIVHCHCFQTGKIDKDVVDKIANKWDDCLCRKCLTGETNKD